MSAALRVHILSLLIAFNLIKGLILILELIKVCWFNLLVIISHFSQTVLVPSVSVLLVLLLMPTPLALNMILSSFKQAKIIITILFLIPGFTWYMFSIILLLCIIAYILPLTSLLTLKSQILNSILISLRASSLSLRELTLFLICYFKTYLTFIKLFLHEIIFLYLFISLFGILRTISIVCSYPRSLSQIS